MDNIVFCFIFNQTLLRFVESAANPTLDDVCTGGLMVTKAVTAIISQWFGHPGAEIESPQLSKDNWSRRGPHCVTVTASGFFGAGCLTAGSFLDLGMA